MKKQTEKLTDDERAFALASIEQTQQTREYERATRWIFLACLPRRPTLKTCSVNRVRLSMFQSVGVKVSEETMGVALARARYSSRTIGGEWSTNVGLNGLRRIDRYGIDAGFEIEMPPGWADAFREPLTPTDALLSAIAGQWC